MDFSSKEQRLDKLSVQISQQYQCDYHELPISVMGSIELMTKRKEYIRDPRMEDE